ncbi:MAG TPA: hypothetical protein VGI75_01680, partial [Pirellulales bacterium]
MATSITSNSNVTDPPAGRRVRAWFGWIIIGVGAFVIACLREFSPFDHGSTNIATGALFGLFLIALGIWTAFFAPYSRARRWSAIAAVVALIMLLIGLVRVEGFTGNMVPIVHWRWTRANIASVTGSKAQIATRHDFP